ncbi:MAG: aminopeptidase P family protein [Salinibacter sp.]
MLSRSTYTRRRQSILGADRPSSGLLLLLGNESAAMNYRGNPYPFRQDSTFLYYFGLDQPAVDGLIDLDSGEACLYGDDPELEDVIWMGEQAPLRERAERAGVQKTAPRSALPEALASAIEADRPVHFLPPYRDRQARRLEQLTGITADRVDDYASLPLIRTVVQHRSVKSTEEIDQIKTAVETTARLHRTAMRRAAPGRRERDVAGALSGIAESDGPGLSFRPTCSVRGEILHNHDYSRTMEAGDLLLVDAGATSPEHYAGDITRVVPVGGPFTTRQRAIYEAVLAAQTAAIAAVEPGVPFREVHLRACRVLTDHLMEIGLMTGTAEAAVEAGAHALFFPHGLGHMMGLDVHDMENLGEDRVGYAEDQERSEQFGLHTLRLARPLRTGFVVTVEPGCYFIPSLIERWRAEGRHEAFIDYEAVAAYEGLGGIRIEDDVLVTNEGGQILGPDLPKRPAAVEELAGSGS